MRLLLAFALFVLFVLPTTAHAHGTRTAYLDVTLTSETEALATFHGEHASAGLRLDADGCSVEDLRGRSFLVRCPRGVAGVALEATGWSVEGVLVSRVTTREGASTGAVLTPRSPRLVLPGRESTARVLVRYVRLGGEHVTSGVDHVLFLLALVWQAASAARGRLTTAARELVRTATAFTLAHTLTLTTTALGVLQVPVVVAEASIAASLVLVALDLRPDDATAPRTRGRTLLAAAFGLVHGLGFATALGDGALTEDAVALGLVGFNVGVELGQALVLAVLLVLVAASRRLTTDRVLANVSAYAVGVTGTVLFLARASLLLASRLP